MARAERKDRQVAVSIRVGVRAVDGDPGRAALYGMEVRYGLQKLNAPGAECLFAQANSPRIRTRDRASEMTSGVPLIASIIIGADPDPTRVWQALCREPP